MPASLYVVSTPIGNLEDMTLRAIKVLKAVGLIAAEDTRRTAILLRHFGIATPATSLHQHNERQKLPQLLGKLGEGTDVALVSDAGTPLVSDPGQRLIAAAIDKGFPIVSIPGASAVLAALTVSGLPADDFVFAGFAPSKSNDRSKWLQRLATETRPIVFFETPHRIHKTLTELPSIIGNRPIIICRELTKLHEETIRTTTIDASTLGVTTRGEFTIVLGPRITNIESPQVIDEKVVIELFYQLTKYKGLLRRPALRQTAQYFGLSTKAVYLMLERLKSGRLP